MYGWDGWLNGGGMVKLRGGGVKWGGEWLNVWMGWMAKWRDGLVMDGWMV